MSSKKMGENKKNPIIYIGIAIIALLLIIVVILLKSKSGVNTSDTPIITKDGEFIPPDTTNDPYVYGVTRDAEHIFEQTNRFTYKLQLNKLPNTAWEPFVLMDGKELPTELNANNGEYFYRYEKINDVFHNFEILKPTLTSKIGKHTTIIGFRDIETKKEFFRVTKDFEVEKLNIDVNFVLTKKKGTYLELNTEQNIKSKTPDLEYDLDYLEWDYTITNNMPYDLNNINIRFTLGEDKGNDYQSIDIYKESINIPKGATLKPKESLVILPTIDKLNDYEYYTKPNSLTDFSYFLDSYKLSPIKRNIMPKEYNAGNYQWIVNDKEEVIKGNFLKSGYTYEYGFVLDNANTQFYTQYAKLELDALN